MNFGQLKAAIASDLNRDDLGSVIADFVEDRIRFYQREFFFGAPQTVTFTTNPGQAAYPFPDSVVNPQLVRMLYYENWQLLSEVAYNDILALDTNVPSTQSPPDLWAPFGLLIRLYPVPDGWYPIEITGHGKLPIPHDDTVTNFWTLDAAMLIRYATAAQIRAVRLRDLDGAQADLVAADRERINLLGETVDRDGRGQFAVNW
jgi:hypothetical protein